MQCLDVFKNVFRSLFPEQCCICNKNSDTAVCSFCEDDVYKDLKISKEDLRFELWCLFPYTNPALQKWLHEIKFEGNQRAAHHLSRFLKNKIYLDALTKVYCVIPIPIHARKKRKRGFNQLDLITKEWVLNHGTSYLDIVTRKKNTKPLFDLSIEERKKELENAFDLHTNYTQNCLNDKTVCLIDDIYTTGATITAVVNLLKTLGVTDIKVVTLARA